MKAIGFRGFPYIFRHTHISNAIKLRNHPIRIGPATDCQINPGYEDGDEPRLPGAARGGKPSEHTLVRTDRLSRHRRYLFSHDLHNVMQYAQKHRKIKSSNLLSAQPETGQRCLSTWFLLHVQTISG